MCKQHALRIAWTIARSIAFLDFRVLRWKFTYDWKCVNTTYRVPLFCPLPASRKGLRLTLRSALFGEGGRDWRPWIKMKKKWNESILEKLEFRQSEVSHGKTEVKKGKFVKFKSPVKGYFRETYKSQNKNTISQTPKFTLGIIQPIY